MAGRWTIGNYEFPTATAFNAAKRDLNVIEGIRKKFDLSQLSVLLKIQGAIENKSIVFHSKIGEDFTKEIKDSIQNIKGGPSRGKFSGEKKKNIKKENKLRHNIVMGISTTVAVGCLGYFAFYCFMAGRTQSKVENLASLIKEEAEEEKVTQVIPSKKEPGEKPEILEKYKSLYLRNKNLIGWLKIADTKIDYPVMQSNNGEYYLDHNFNQEYDKNGTLFVDNDCDVLRPSDNIIIYGHNMKSGEMFGSLEKYKNESYYQEHPRIEFDTIYETGTYEVMFAFLSRVFYEGEITFKYYQFINASSDQEFSSAIEAMKELSLYDTGVTANYGDQLLTLSTCDYTEDDGRFVVVANKIS